MYMTEEEAKVKFCPYRGDLIFTDPENPLSFKRGNVCLASDCMAWRRDGAEERSTTDGYDTYTQMVIIGHCGLAGPVVE